MTDIVIQESHLPLLTNADAIAGRYPYSFASHYLLEKNTQGLRIVEMVESRAGIVMSPIAGKKVWLKSDFMRLGAPDCNPDLKAQAVLDFAVDEANIENLCTVGCGTNVVFRFSNGLFYAAVERTAPNATDAGTVNAGLYSRAAGSSTGDIDLTAWRELIEEMSVVVKDGTQQKLLHIIPDIYQIDPRTKMAILETKQDRFPSILAAHNVSGLSLSDSFEVKAKGMTIAGLTEDIIERRTGLKDKILASRVFGHAPQQMDINGIDTVVLVDLSHLSSSSVLGIWDGEKNQKGELLKRKWSLFALDDIRDKLSNGQIKMSPVPGRVIAAADDVRQAIDLHLKI